MSRFFNKLLILSLASLALTACNTTQLMSESSSDLIPSNNHIDSTAIVGKYYGVIDSSGIKNQSVTTFYLNDNHEIVGYYQFDEGAAQVVSGTLSNCTRIAQRKLHCLWADKYGTGHLSMTFNQSFNEFVGVWSMQADTTGSAWTGKKQ